jgi:hypothetical protein
MSRRMPLKGHPYHYKSDAELDYIKKDAGEAAKAMRGMNPKAEGKYLDQVNDASTVSHYRKNGGRQLQVCNPNASEMAHHFEDAE